MKIYVLLLFVLVAGCSWTRSGVTEGQNVDGCDSKYIICAYQGKSYDSPELGVMLSPRDVAGDSSGTLNIKLPGHPLEQAIAVKVGDAWTFNANGIVYTLTIINIEMNMQFYDARGGRIKFKLTH